MAEKEKDLNKGQSVADSDLNKDQSVAGQDLNTSGQSDESGKLADGTDENKTVPYTKLKEAVDAKNTAEELLQKQAQDHQSQMAILQANQQPVQQSQQPLSDYDQAKADLGLTDTEYIDEVQRSSIHTRMIEITNARNHQSAAVFANQQFEGSHPDFGNVVGLRNLVNGRVQPTAEILEILAKKPYLTAAAYASSQGAYEIVMEERKLVELEKNATVNQEQRNRQGLDNASLPLGGSAAGGGGTGDAQNQTMMTRAQVLEIEEKLAAGEKV